MSEFEPNITVLGGGTGSFTLLQELKHLTPNISAVVNMSDDGGSSGRLRDELGVLPPGDLRQCLVALSELSEVRDLFSYRFGEDEGSLAGHSLGNIIVSGLERQYDGDITRAVKVASTLLNITGKVIPITTEQHTLVMSDGDELIRGEYVIGHRTIKHRSATVRLEPKAEINPDAEEAIAKADVVAIAPGNLYGSLLPILAVRGVREAIHHTDAHLTVITNLVTKPGQTDGWHVVDYVHEFEKYIGNGRVDTVLYNTDLPDQELLTKYAAEGEYPLDTAETRFNEIVAAPIGASLVAKEAFKVDHKDKAIRRTLIRHDARKVGERLIKLARQEAI